MLNPQSEMTNRRVADGGRQRAGSRDAVTKYNSGAAISYPPLPHGSIYASGSFLESPDAIEPGLQKFILFERASLIVGTAAALVLSVILLFADLQ